MLVKMITLKNLCVWKLRSDRSLRTVATAGCLNRKCALGRIFGKSPLMIISFGCRSVNSSACISLSCCGPTLFIHLPVTLAAAPTEKLRQTSFGTKICTASEVGSEDK